MNVEENNASGETNQKSVDFHDLQSWTQVDEEVLLVESNEVLSAKHAELQNLKDHSVFEEVPFVSQSLVHVRWVLTEKWKNGTKHTKARLVAKGFQDKGDENLRKDSPTCLRDSLHILLMIAANNNWLIRSLDVKCAFLQGKEIQREVFLKPPCEANTDMVWKLRKTIYGLGEASRQWYLKLKETLESLSMKMSLYDEAVFYMHVKGKLCGVIALHVDDFFFCGSDMFHHTVMEKVKSLFMISKEEERCFNYLGLEIEQSPQMITVHQASYAKDLSVIDIDKKLLKTDELPAEKFAELRSLLGQLSWLATHTRADISFDVCQLNVKLK